MPQSNVTSYVEVRIRLPSEIGRAFPDDHTPFQQETLIPLSVKPEINSSETFTTKYKTQIKISNCPTVLNTIYRDNHVLIRGYFNKIAKKFGFSQELDTPK